jgi:hypothetical protein
MLDVNRIPFYSEFGFERIPFYLGFDLDRFPYYSGFSLNRIPYYSGFGLDEILFYSGFSLDRFHCILKETNLFVLLLMPYHEYTSWHRCQSLY